MGLAVLLAVTRDQFAVEVHRLADEGHIPSATTVASHLGACSLAVAASSLVNAATEYGAPASVEIMLWSSISASTSTIHETHHCKHQSLMVTMSSS